MCLSSEDGTTEPGFFLPQTFNFQDCPLNVRSACVTLVIRSGHLFSISRALAPASQRAGCFVFGINQG